MYELSALLLAIAGAGGSVAPVSQDPPVIAKMEEVGTVYLTRVPSKKKGKKDEPIKVGPKQNTIIGVDFRPMAGTDPKLVAALVKELETLPDLRTLLLLGHDVTDDAIAVLPARLENVRLFNTAVTDKGMAKLGRLQRLTSFSYTGTMLTDAGLKDIASLKSLTSLSITDAKGVTNDGVMVLGSLKSLFSLTIENTSVTQPVFNRLIQQLPIRFERDFRSI